jgi:hypothetical protein
VAQDRIDPSRQIPEADLLDQQAPFDPRLTEDEPIRADRETAVEPVDQADRWEQHIPVPTGEDDYPHDSFDARWP